MGAAARIYCGRIRTRICNGGRARDTIHRVENYPQIGWDPVRQLKIEITIQIRRVLLEILENLVEMEAGFSVTPASRHPGDTRLALFSNPERLVFATRDRLADQGS